MGGSNFKRKHPFGEPRQWKAQVATGADRQFYIVPWPSPYFGRLYLTRLVISNDTAGIVTVKMWDEHIGFAGMNAAKVGDNANDNTQFMVPADAHVTLDLDAPFQAGIAFTVSGTVNMYAEMEVVGN
jgi:hypothetical protein